MYKYFLAGMNVIIFVIGIAALYILQKPPSPTIVVPEVISSTSPQIPNIVHAVNSANSRIKSFYCEKTNIQAWYKGMRTKSQGELYYEPTKRFRFFARSIMGLELDMGSNDSVFWFWSKRTKEPGLYYARYEDFSKTRLKTPLNPLWIKGSLGLDVIDTKKAKFSEQEKDLLVIQEATNSIGSKVLVYTFIEKSTSRIRGFSLTDTKGRTLASAEITYNTSNIPAKIFYSWKEEERDMLIEFVNPTINTYRLDKKLWEIPSYTPRIDMGKNNFTSSDVS
jgi:hypothetical protein